MRVKLYFQAVRSNLWRNSGAEVNIRWSISWYETSNTSLRTSSSTIANCFNVDLSRIWSSSSRCGRSWCGWNGDTKNWISWRSECRSSERGNDGEYGKHFGDFSGWLTGRRVRLIERWSRRRSACVRRGFIYDFRRGIQNFGWPGPAAILVCNTMHLSLVRMLFYLFTLQCPRSISSSPHFPLED